MEAPNRLRGLKVLIVEDDIDSRQLLCEFLGSCDATVVEASSGELAFRAFVRDRPDVVVSDVRMKDGDGFELIARIRALAPEQGGLVPAIAISANVNADQALMAGYHAVLTKPVDPDVLESTIDEFFHAESDLPSPNSRWTVSSTSHGTVAMNFAGYVAPADVHSATALLLRYLDEGPCEIVVDLHRVTGFSPAGASVAQRALWPKRQAIRHVRILGGPVSARVIASATCRLLGLGCTVEDGPVDATG